jgi:isoquinoline 1-oxidoreductase beta subunit
VALKRPEEFRLIGKLVKRLDTPAKVNGTAVYGIDYARPGREDCNARAIAVRSAAA